MKDTRIPKFRRAVIQNFPFIEEDFDALTDYGLICKIVEYLNKVIDKANYFDQQYDELNAAFVQLKSYVDNYFANLDVQEEINNKLDDMAESGELAEIVAAYLAVKAILAFDTPADLKNATNLIDGSYAKTYGYKRKDDGVYDYYYVREKTVDDSNDDYNVIVLTNDNTLVAIRCQQGAKRLIQLKSTDDIQEYLNLEGEKEIVLPAGITITKTDVLLLNSDTTIDLNKSTIVFNFDRSSIFDYDWDETLGFMSYKPTDEFTGYGGHENITIKNGSIVGGCSCFMHSANVLFENVYFQTAGARHSIQFAACKEFTVRDCTFEGARDDSTDNASELINIDICAYGAQPYISQYSPMFDGTKNLNVVVENNVFKQTTAAGLGYFAAVGTHGNDATTDPICENIVIRNNDFGFPREYAIGLKNYNNVDITGNNLVDALNTYNPRFIMKRGIINKANISNNVAKGTDAFFESQNPNYAGNMVNITNNIIVANDTLYDYNAVFILINIHDSLIANNSVQFNHHEFHINTRAYADSVDDNPNDHTINLIIQNNTFEKLVNQSTYFGARVSTCDKLKIMNNNFIHDGTLESNWQDILFQNTQTNLAVQGNITDNPMHFCATAKVTANFVGNTALYIEKNGANSSNITDNFVGNATNYSELLLVVGESANTEVLSIRPFYYNGYKLDGSRTFKLPTTKNDGTYAAATFTISNSGATWAYVGDKPLRGIYAKD